jgi:hypothetical protein
MQTRRTFALAGVLALSLALPAQANASFIFNPQPPFENLLPDGFALTDAPPIDPASLHDRKVALIPTQNLNRYAEGWLDYYERGGAHRNWAIQLFGRSDDDLNAEGRLSDPRKLTDQVIDLIRPAFGEVVVAQDLPSAREQGADYFLILDCAMSLRGFWSDKVRVDGGVYLLDASLHRVFEDTTFAEASLGGLLDNPITSSEAGIDAAMRGMLTQLSAGVRAHLAVSQ